jgi:hypothetical protein
VARTSSAGRIGARGRRAVAERDPVDQLFTVGPSEFVQRRNALTKALRDAGRSGEAREVERLRRPSPAVWLANRLARQDPEGVTRFIDAVDRLKRAHLGRGNLVQATESQRNALERLLAEARAIQMDAATQGVPRGTMGRLSATLVGAAADEDQRAQLAQGRLTRESTEPGFELFAGARVEPRRGAGSATPVAQPSPRVAFPGAVRGQADSRRGGQPAAKATSRKEVVERERRARAIERAARRHRAAIERGEQQAAALRARLKALEERIARERAAAEKAERETPLRASDLERS